MADWSGDVRRRQLLAGGAMFFVSGCTTDENGSENPTPRIEVEPQNPQVGSEVVLRAVFGEEDLNPDADGSYPPVHYYWSFGNNQEVDARGQSITHRFKSPGQQLVRVLAINDSILLHHYDEDPRGITNFADATGPGEPERYRIHSHSVQVGTLPEQRLSVETELINLYLKAERRTIPIDSDAVLQFSAANLSDDDALIVDLLLEVPTGLRVSGTSFDSGGGQYSSRYKISPGGTDSEMVKISANEPGTYEIRGRAVYNFEGTSSSRQSTNQQILLQYHR